MWVILADIDCNIEDLPFTTRTSLDWAWGGFGVALAIRHIWNGFVVLHEMGGCGCFGEPLLEKDSRK